ncbi:MAG: hypothetical protein HZA69_04710 [Gammaproteobacteria bacterium]|nr:hypothetical protein [Gammaproteobacteria bacterium]
MVKHGAKTKSRKNPNHVFVASIRRLSKESSAAVLRLMALTYLSPYRVHKDREYGRLLLMTSGQSGDRVASRLLADYYFAGGHGFPKDKERSIYWWLRSERRLWSEQTPLYRFKLWKLSWSTGENPTANMLSPASEKIK